MPDELLVFTNTNSILKTEKFIKNFVYDKMVLAIDFDLSLSIDISWKKFAEMLSYDAQKINTQIDNKYKIKDIYGKLTLEDEINWISEKLNLYKEENLTKDHIIKAAKIITLRQSADKIINLFGIKNTVIISFGIYDLIDEFAKINRLNEITICANKFIYNCKNEIIGFDKNTLVTPSLKGKILKEFCKNKNIPLKNVMVIGDSKGDEKMFLKETLNILVSPNGNGYNIKNIDIILKSRDFTPLITLFKKIQFKYY